MFMWPVTPNRTIQLSYAVVATSGRIRSPEVGYHADSNELASAADLDRGAESLHSGCVDTGAASGTAAEPVCRAALAADIGSVCSMINAVVFDVGETLVDETREYGTWADWLGVPRHTFVSVFGATIALGGDYRETFQVFKPGFDLAAEREARAQAGQPETYGEEDLYPDVRPALSALREIGVWVGIVGNQTARSGRILRSLELPTDFVATSDDWGVEKPSIEFFEKVVEVAPCDAHEVVYVGDRIENDIAPAKAVGMRTAYIQRGPWGWIQRKKPEVAELSDWMIHDLTELTAIAAAENDS
ncbi:HAD family hydrolase [Nocardia sp. NPDC127579]|uniref:HAD family hydrolase n=1 Tax=Nocardia sp. NPDC127579 TaxID=3345402 RepID=UPI00362DBBF9